MTVHIGRQLASLRAKYPQPRVAELDNALALRCEGASGRTAYARALGSSLDAVDALTREGPALGPEEREALLLLQANMAEALLRITRDALLRSLLKVRLPIVPVIRLCVGNSSLRTLALPGQLSRRAYAALVR